MSNCKVEIEHYITNQKDIQETKQMSKKMRKTGSYLSMENLDIEEESDEGEDAY
jgi:hypothetical protein